MTNELLKLKIKALLHDPPEKAGILLETGLRHEKVAKEHVVELLDEGVSKALRRKIGVADHIASGADRYNFPEVQEGRSDEDRYPFNVHFLDRPFLRHPLSGDILQIPAITNDKPAFITGIQNAVSRALQEIKERYGSATGESNRLRLYYLSLWREMVGLLQQNEPPEAKIGALWQRLPAETRMPDHTIWEHLSLVSALTGARIDEGGESQASLVLFTIGPVQRFISAARKTTDLWAGSYMLSLLTWRAMKVFCRELGPDSILFPDLFGQPLVDKWLREEGLEAFEYDEDFYAATLPNRFMALVPTEKVKSLTSLAEEKVREGMVAIGSYGLKKLKIPVKHWEDQLATYPDCYWASLPIHRFSKEKMEVSSIVDAFKKAYPAPFMWDDKQADHIVDAFDESARHTNVGAFYGRLYSLLNSLVNARKSLRNFDTSFETGYRCSLHPDLPAVTPTSDAPPGEVRTFWEEKADATQMPGRIRKGERLSAIGIAKRYFPKYLKEKLDVESQFPSTSSFACADYKLDIVRALKEQTPDAEAIRTRVQAFTEGLIPYHRRRGEKDGIPKESTIALIREEAKGLGIDMFLKISGSWLFEESYQFSGVDKEYSGLFSGQEELDPLKNNLQALLFATDDAGIDRPSKYYGVLLLDGDKMGEWLSGKRNVSFADALHPDVVDTLHKEFAEGKYEKWQALLDGEYKRPMSPSLHLAISRSLKYFALERVRHIVESQYCGRVVYAGGDDVMALTSFRSALPIAKTVRAAFSGHINQEGNVDWALSGTDSLDASRFYSMGARATASAGVVLAHRQQSLQQVLQAARITEQFAKGKRVDEQLLNLDELHVPLNRNALALTVMKRNGEPITTGIKWYGLDGVTDLVSALERFSALVRGGHVSSSLIYDLERETVGLSLYDQQGGAGELSERSLAPVMHEAFRLFVRHAGGMRFPEKTEVDMAWLREAVTAHRSGGVDRMRRIAFDETIGILLKQMHKVPDKCNTTLRWPTIESHLLRTVRLLEVAQFIGKGGAR